MTFESTAMNQSGHEAFLYKTPTLLRFATNVDKISGVDLDRESLKLTTAISGGSVPWGVTKSVISPQPPFPP